MSSSSIFQAQGANFKRKRALREIMSKIVVSCLVVYNYTNLGAIKLLLLLNIQVSVITTVSD